VISTTDISTTPQLTPEEPDSHRKLEGFERWRVLFVIIVITAGVSLVGYLVASQVEILNLGGENHQILQALSCAKTNLPVVDEPPVCKTLDNVLELVAFVAAVQRASGKPNPVATTIEARLQVICSLLGDPGCEPTGKEP
jgi:hypothetical protein